LIDRLIAKRHGATLLPKQLHNHIHNSMTSARRFVLTENAAIRSAQVMRTLPDLMVEASRFARAPFDLTWIEFPFRAFYQELTQTSPDLDCDATVGYFIDHGRVYCASSTQDATARPLFMPIVYGLNEEWPIDEQLDFCSRMKVSRLGCDQFMWGSTYNFLNEDQRRQMRAQHSMHLLADRRFDHNGLTDMMNSAVGDLRTIVGLLLLLNRPSLTTYRDAPASRGYFNKKFRGYLSHTTVDIPLDPVPQLRLVGTPADDASPRRRHEVRGHWCHDAQARRRTCVHQWEAEDEDHFTCSVCLGKRWWRRDCVRGHSGLGFVQKDYAVTTHAD
jgi:hypothetical protein